jgi:hypothetical protein
MEDLVGTVTSVVYRAISMVSLFSSCEYSTQMALTKWCIWYWKQWQFEIMFFVFTISKFWLMKYNMTYASYLVFRQNWTKTMVSQRWIRTVEFVLGTLSLRLTLVQVVVNHQFGIKLFTRKCLFCRETITSFCMPIT